MGFQLGAKSMVCIALITALSGFGGAGLASMVSISNEKVDPWICAALAAAGAAMLSTLALCLQSTTNSDNADVEARRSS